MSAIVQPQPSSRRNKLIGLAVAVLLLGLFIYSVQDWHQLWKIVSAPDNVPIVAMLFLVPFFTWLGIRQAVVNDRLIGELESEPKLAKTHHRKAEPWRPGWAKELHVWPYLVRIEFLAAVIVTVVLYVWSITLNAPLEEPSNPNLTMNPSKAPWYFLGLQEIVAGVPGFGFLGTNWIAKMIFGGIVVGAFYLIGGLFFHWLMKRGRFKFSYLISPKKFLEWAKIPDPFEAKLLANTSLLQYMTFQFFAISVLLAMPVKLFLRLVFTIKYVWVTPWFNV